MERGYSSPIGLGYRGAYSRRHVAAGDPVGTVYTYTASGTFTPNFTGTVSAECTGGGCAADNTTNAQSGGGGGAYSKGTVSVTSGVPVTVTVGAGGVVHSGTFGGAGGDTSFGASVIAKGATGRSGATAAASTGTTKFDGGGGTARIAIQSAGGGGGASGNRLANGANGAGQNGGVGVNGGGSGGNGSFIGSTTVAGVAPGGGGGGGDGAVVAGAGARGVVILTRLT